LPELCFLFVDVVLRFDHTTGLAEWVVSARGRDQAQARSRCAALLAAHSERWARGASAQAEAVRSQARCPEVGAVHAYADEQEYAASVRAAQAHILAGDAFEVCISQRLEAAMPSSRAAAWALYRALRAESPAPFACCVLTPWASLLSSSPERFLQLGADRWAESRPIKGTRPRGADAAEDESLKRDLETSEKDRAENVMIVDLVRNDLGRVCAVGSVHVPELMVVEAHPRVFQLVSSVRGRLEDGISPVALFCVCFPPGSMTGAPKIESMKIIDDLEPYRRGIYAGAVGYFDLGGAMDFSVVIRSFVIVGERYTFSVGGAVVADSDPVGEYRESMDKARALLAALEAERARGDEAADPR
jgi:aminodeoxychorismate synthase component I